MRALRWILGGVAVVVVLAVLAIAIGAAWLNTYIHSDAFKVEVESRAASSLGGTVKIGKIDFNVFTGVKLQGLVTQIDSAPAIGQGMLGVTVTNVTCTYTWTELLHRRLRLTGVTLDQPQFILNKEITAPVTAQALPGAMDSGAMQGEGTALPFQFILDQVRINNGSVSVQDGPSKSLGGLTGIDMDANTSGYSEGKDITGTLKIADIAMPPNWHVTRFSTPFTYNPAKGGFAASPFAASAYGGNLAGDFQPRPSQASILNLNGKGVDVSQLTSAMTSNSSAKLTGTLDFQSTWIENGDRNAEGDFQLTDGKLEGVKMLQEIGQVLKVKELEEPIIKKAQSHFIVLNWGQTQLTSLQIQSSIFSITGGGTINFDGPLNLDLVLILTRDAMNKLPSAVAASFVKQQDGTGTIAFHVSGTMSDPQTDLPQRLLMQNTQIQNVLNKAINKLFH